MPSCPLPPIVVFPVIDRGWSELGTTSVKSILIACAWLFVKAPPVIDTGEKVLSPSEAVFLILVPFRIKFWVRRGPLGVRIEIPVTAYRISESVSRFVLNGATMPGSNVPGSSTRPPQSPALVGAQTPEILGTKTEPQLDRIAVCSLRLVRTAP